MPHAYNEEAAAAAVPELPKSAPFCVCVCVHVKWKEKVMRLT
jgi:hypothetical protein